MSTPQLTKTEREFSKQLTQKQQIWFSQLSKRERDIVRLVWREDQKCFLQSNAIWRLSPGDQRISMETFKHIIKSGLVSPVWIEVQNHYILKPLRQIEQAITGGFVSETPSVSSMPAEEVNEHMQDATRNEEDFVPLVDRIAKLESSVAFIAADQKNKSASTERNVQSELNTLKSEIASLKSHVPIKTRVSDLIVKALTDCPEVVRVWNDGEELGPMGGRPDCVSIFYEDEQGTIHPVQIATYTGNRIGEKFRQQRRNP